MTELDRGTDRAGRRKKRFLSPSQKYEIWLQLVRQEATIAEVAAQQHVDRSTIMRIRTVAKEGALAALAASKARCGSQAARLRAGAGQGRERSSGRGPQGDGGQADADRGKRRLGLSGQVPTRVEAATQAGLLDLVDEALEQGWSLEQRRGVPGPRLGDRCGREPGSADHRRPAARRHRHGSLARFARRHPDRTMRRSKRLPVVLEPRAGLGGRGPHPRSGTLHDGHVRGRQ